MLNTQVLYHTYKETQRHNIATENLTQQQISESIRHNVVSENQNWASINETVRHNRQQESIGFQNIALGYAQLEETTRHNYAQESIGRTQARASLQQAYAATKNAISQQRMADVATFNAGVQASYVDSQKKLMAQQRRTSKAEASYKEALKRKAHADTRLTNQESDWYVYNQILNGVSTVSGSLKDLSLSFKNLKQSK